MDHSTPGETARQAQPLRKETGVPPLEQPVLPRIQEFDRLVETLVASWHGSPVVQNRRCHRIGYKKPIALTPLDDRIDVTIGETSLAECHDLSPEGVSFAHSAPLPYRKIAATFVVEEGLYESVVVRLTWCRFTSQGRYKSGGKFLRTIRLTIDPDVDWAELPRA